MTRNKLELLWILAKTDFRLRYHGSLLGFLWALLKPLLIFLILNFVFKHIFGFKVDHFSLRLFVGIMLWNFFAESTMSGMTSLLVKSNLITKIPTPKWIIVIASTLNTFLSFLINILILFALFINDSVYPDFLSILYFIFIIICLCFLIMGIALLTAPLFIKFRDLNQIWEVLLTAGFYAAPIIYPLSVIPTNLQSFLYINPMTTIILYAQEMLIDKIYPAFSEMIILFSIFSLFLLLCIYLFSKLSYKVSEEL